MNMLAPNGASTAGSRRPNNVKRPIELFMPPNMLKAKAGGGLGGIDIAAVKRGESAVATLKSEFGGMMADDVKTLIAARARYAKAPGAKPRAALMRAAHDIKGQAATFQFPLIARVAGSLARLIDELPGPLPDPLIDAHVTAIQVIHRQNMQHEDDATAQALCTELDARVSELLAPAEI
jgi:HPt (histidine-containing phosphotransfer) domain-containing protein